MLGDEDVGRLQISMEDCFVVGVLDRVADLAEQLSHRIRGTVHYKGSPYYEKYRHVQNGICSHIYPAIIARPVSTEDVSQIVKFSNEVGIDLSIRSGGHSYQCQGTKSGSLNVDMRRMNKVELVDPYTAKLGPGSNWQRVLSIIKPSDYKYFLFLNSSVRGPFLPPYLKVGWFCARICSISALFVCFDSGDCPVGLIMD